uniref:Secreted protein n=1 Tax=Strongyloides venezuelensis TaxID=75913 RepID=A0A0K0EXS7_STRVS
MHLNYFILFWILQFIHRLDLVNSIDGFSNVWNNVAWNPGLSAGSTYWPFKEVKAHPSCKNQPNSGIRIT